MKKIICIGVIGALVLSICGCSDDRYDELERRVSALEERLAESSSIETQIVDTATTAAKGDVSESSSDVLAGAVYDLSNMSAREIVDLVSYYIDNRPKQGDSYDDVYARLKIQPIYFSHDNSSISIRYRDNFYVNNDDENEDIYDEVTSISYGNARPSMNGSTIDVPDPYFKTNIGFTIQDYSRAEEIFDLLAEFFSNASYTSDVNVRRDNGTVWEITFMTDFDGVIGGTGHVRMKKSTNGYIFGVEIP